MVDAPQNTEADLYRIILFASGGAELLVLPENGRLRLPTLGIPKHQRVARNLTASMRCEWFQEAVCLFCLDSTPTSSEARYQVMESCEESPPHAAGSRWVSVSSLEESQFEEAADYAAVAKSFAACKEYAGGRTHGPFARLGWFAELIAWVHDEIRTEGLTLSGRFSQLNSSPTFSLVRFETNGPAVWFKAVGAPNVREFRISRNLARLLPRFVPRMLAVREDWNAWLSAEAEGTQPDQNSDLSSWTMVATALADLQIASLGNTLHLIDAGCRDVRACTLGRLVDPFFEVMAELMDRQTKDSPAPLSRKELTALGAQLKDAVSRYQDLEIHNTLGHLDFNPGNIIASEGRCVFLDWAEAYAGPPFLTFEYLREHLRRLRHQDSSCEAALVDAYSRNWQCFLSPAKITGALALSPLLAVFAYAASGAAWRDETRRCDQPTAGYLRSLTRRVKREAEH